MDSFPNKAVKISLLARDGTLPARSGLNWGQRPELNRDPDQAYLPLRKDAREEGYLPERGYTFTLVTDDNQALDCVVAQDGRKCQSTEDNSLLGSYIRSRLGVEPGSFLTNEDLIEYGRTDFTLIKIGRRNNQIRLFSRSTKKLICLPFNDRREAIPARSVRELAHTKGRGHPRHAGKRNVWLQALWGVWQELWKIHGGR